MITNSYAYLTDCSGEFDGSLTSLNLDGDDEIREEKEKERKIFVMNRQLY